jgi:hypothetical protein
LEHHEHLRRFTPRNTFTRNAVIISFKLVSLQYVSRIE